MQVALAVGLVVAPVVVLVVGFVVALVLVRPVEPDPVEPAVVEFGRSVVLAPIAKLMVVLVGLDAVLAPVGVHSLSADWLVVDQEWVADSAVLDMPVVVLGPVLE